MMRPQFPCRFEETSHQHYARGWCYGIGIAEEGEIKGRPYALLVYDGGSVGIRLLDRHYSIKLLGH